MKTTKEPSNDFVCTKKKTLENTEGAIKNGQSIETGNIGYIRHKTNKTNTQHNIC